MGGRVIGIGVFRGGKLLIVDAGSKRDLPLSLGAEHFVDYETETDVAGAVEQLTCGGAHVTWVVDHA
jgi:Zn-dependent alcohol dehydrogenase